MQVNSAQNNNTSFQALKINSKLKSELEKLSLQQIKAIKKLGEDVKGVRHYDICFEDNIVTPKIRRTKSPSSIFPPLSKPTSAPSPP